MKKKLELLRKPVIIAILVVTLIMFLIQYATAITFNISYVDGYTAFTIYLFVIGIILSLHFGNEDIKEFIKERKTKIKKVREIKENYKWIALACLVCLPTAISVILNIFSAPFFNSKKYRDQIGEFEEQEVSKYFDKFDFTKIPVVDEQLAEKLADKKLGEKESLGSQAKIGKPVIQLYKDKLVWVVPLQHSGFFKWFANKEGTQGYILVSATDQTDVQYIDKYKIKYQPNLYFNYDILRKVRYSFEGYMEGLTDFSFEIDEEGIPYWVFSTYKNEKFLKMKEITGVITLNAQNGEINKYSLDKLPKWVDRVQSEDIIIEQLRNKGEYINGIFNFSNKDKFIPSSTGNIIYNSNNFALLTGLTSKGANESIESFVSVNMKDKKVYKFNISGATEYAAEKSAEGKVQNLGYNASNAILVNVDSVPTYFMTLKDKEGLIKQYAFVNVKDYTTVITNEKLESALKEYKKIINKDGNIEKEIAEENLTTLELRVIRIAPEKIKDDLVYKIILDTRAIPNIQNKSVIFIAKANLSEKLALTQPGDLLEIKYQESDDDIIYVEEIENKTI